MYSCFFTASDAETADYPTPRSTTPLTQILSITPPLLHAPQVPCPLAVMRLRSAPGSTRATASPCPSRPTQSLCATATRSKASLRLPSRVSRATTTTRCHLRRGLVMAAAGSTSSSRTLVSKEVSYHDGFLGDKRHVCRWYRVTNAGSYLQITCSASKWQHLHQLQTLSNCML